MARKPFARALSFAHLIGPSASEEDDDQTTRKEDQTGPNAETQDGGKEGGGGDGKPQDGKKESRRAEDDSDDQDEQDETDETARAARERERARCAAIFSDKSAALNPALAARIAFGTRLPRSQAVQLLQDGTAALRQAQNQAQQQAGLHDRMAELAGFRTSGAGAPAQTRTQSVKSSWDAAASRIGIPTRG